MTPPKNHCSEDGGTGTTTSGTATTTCCNISAAVPLAIAELAASTLSTHTDIRRINQRLHDIVQDWECPPNAGEGGPGDWETASWTSMLSSSSGPSKVTERSQLELRSQVELRKLPWNCSLGIAEMGAHSEPVCSPIEDRFLMRRCAVSCTEVGALSELSLSPVEDRLRRELRSMEERIYRQLQEQRQHLADMLREPQELQDAVDTQANVTEQRLLRWQASLEADLQARLDEFRRSWVSQQDLANSAELLKQEVAKLVGEAVARNGVRAVTREELASVVYELRAELAALEMASGGDVPAAAKALRQEVRHLSEAKLAESRAMVVGRKPAGGELSCLEERAARSEEAVEEVKAGMRGLREDMAKQSAQISELVFASHRASLNAEEAGMAMRDLEGHVMESVNRLVMERVPLRIETTSCEVFSEPQLSPLKGWNLVSKELAKLSGEWMQLRSRVTGCEKDLEELRAAATDPVAGAKAETVHAIMAKSDIAEYCGKNPVTLHQEMPPGRAVAKRAQLYVVAPSAAKSEQDSPRTCTSSTASEPETLQ